MIFLCFVQMMGKESEVEKHKFHHHKNLILLEVIDIKNIQLSSMVFSGNECFISYKSDDQKIKPLHIMLPKTSVYVKSY